jgi:hypothetical protein
MRTILRPALLLLVAWAAVSPPPASADGAGPPSAVSSGQGGQPGSSAVATATLQQCLTAGPEGERSVTFAAQMTMIPGSTRMQMRADLLERRPGETNFRLISTPGWGSWLEADPGVRTYRNLRQVTSLIAPATYRAEVDFRWLNAKGRIIRRMRLSTPRCAQTSVPSGATGPAGAPGTAPDGA